MAKLAVYRDTDFTGTSYFVGRPEWQDCQSRVWAVGEYDTRKQAEAAAERLGKLSDAELDARKRWYETPGRFEDACERGDFGATW